jgi:membrane protein
MADAVGQYGLRLAARSQIQRFYLVLRRAMVSAYKDNCFGIAKGAAYSALLSFFPVLTTLTAILVQANADAVSRIMARFIFQAVPPGTEELVRQIFTERGSEPALLLVTAGLLAIWAASGVMLSLMEGFRAAYRIPQGRPFLKQRGVAALLVFSAAIPFVTAAALIVFGGRIEKWVLESIGVLVSGVQVRGWVLIVSQTLRYGIAAASIVLSITLLYCIGPNPPRRLRKVWPGAMLAAVLWFLITVMFAWYVRNIANYNVLYGSVGAVIALLVWMYLLSVIALLGCEYNAERDRLLAEGFDV